MIYYYNYISDYQTSNIPFDLLGFSGRTIFSINSTKIKVLIFNNEILTLYYFNSIYSCIVIFVHYTETVFQKDFTKQTGIIFFAFASIAYYSYLKGRSVYR